MSALRSWAFRFEVAGILLVLSGCAGMRSEAVKPRALNNFVTELLLVKNLSDDGAHAYVIRNPREGWLFLKSDAWVGKEGGVSVGIGLQDAGEPETVIAYEPKDSGTAEAMRYLAEGTYTVRVDLHEAEIASLTVRTIPAIIYANFPESPHMPRFGRYDWTFLKSIGMLDSCNVLITYRGGHFMKEWLAQGKQVLQQAGVPNLHGSESITVQEAYDYWIEAAGLSDPGMSGIIADEFYPSANISPKFPAWIEAIKRIRKDKPNKVFYPYIAGSAKGLRPFVEPLLDTGCCFAYERYLNERRTEKEAKAFIEQGLKGEMLEFEKYAPGFSRRCIYVMGFLCGPNESLSKNPAADYKVYLDMQFHLLATDPVFKEGLYGVEQYRSPYCDEEYLRWCAKLFRHYCIEGRAERLTNDPYELTHIRNPEFEHGLEGWTVEAATPDSVQVKKMEGYGWVQGRYPKDAQGDTFLWMKCSAQKPNAISQTIGNLEPGRYYSVKMISGDYQNHTKHQILGLSLRVEGVELIPEECIQAIYHNHPSHRNERFATDYAYFNWHRLVFRATSDTAKLTISDWSSPTSPAASSDQEIIFNFIEVEPYLMPE